MNKSDKTDSLNFQELLQTKMDFVPSSKSEIRPHIQIKPIVSFTYQPHILSLQTDIILPWKR